MKFKLDENLGTTAQEILRAAGHDVSTVPEEELGGSPDRVIFDASVREARALLTLDRDFGEVLRFPPHESHGIVVLALRGHPSLQEISARLRDFLAVLEERPLGKELWIVEAGRVRIHESPEPD